ncbi:uncharacterized protein BJ171DRAFT_583484 [Polychytrium aggregatum]|uniref:uncharacterized protein n=1 Tax=Polychytrium aggregatum TaxID=110093 RepID=UPI0022FE837D|nr:uncharacterized protein BJ171DRAFT_583484 [Polychytrium aggregatum]KAI9203000.1 hypothetical protein BJ171DRAFT_583484 [Polychytrium aggregatum]
MSWECTPPPTSHHNSGAATSIPLSSEQNLPVQPSSVILKIKMKPILTSRLPPELWIHIFSFTASIADAVSLLSCSRYHYRMLKHRLEAQTLQILSRSDPIEPSLERAARHGKTWVLAGLIDHLRVQTGIMPYLPMMLAQILVVACQGRQTGAIQVLLQHQPALEWDGHRALRACTQHSDPEVSRLLCDHLSVRSISWNTTQAIIRRRVFKTEAAPVVSGALATETAASGPATAPAHTRVVVSRQVRTRRLCMINPDWAGR